MVEHINTHKGTHTYTHMGKLKQYLLVYRTACVWDSLCI